MTDNLALPKPITTGITTPRAAASTTAVQDHVWLLLQDKRSPATRRAYKGDLVDFFGTSPTPDVVKMFVGQAVPLLAQRLVLYREEMRAKGLGVVCCPTATESAQHGCRMGHGTRSGHSREGVCFLK